jgi:alpha-mannosidase
MFGVGKKKILLKNSGNDGLINAPDPNRSFTLKTAQVVVLDKAAFDLYMDFLVIYEIAKELPEDSSRGNQAMFTCNEMINLIDTSNPETWKDARKLAKSFFDSKNGDSQHKILAVGHWYFFLNSFLKPYRCCLVVAL